ncbi:hypothetical protein [Kaarinaea lacus]
MNIKNRFSQFYSVIAFLFISSVIMAGCASDDNGVPSVEPIEAAMKTMTPLGYAASLFMARVNESQPANTECASQLCVTTLEIPFDQQTRQSFPVELVTEGTAKLYVAGAWTSATAGSAIDGAVISLLFIDMRGGSFGFPTYKISTVPVTKTEFGISTVYSTSDIGVEKDTAMNALKAEISDLSMDDLNNAVMRLKNLFSDISDSLELNMSKDYWLVNVEDVNGTPDDFTDDSFGLSGGGVYVDIGLSSGIAYQVGLTNVVMGNNCKTNPSEGKALISEAEVDPDRDSSSWLQLGYVRLQFDAMCDGRAYVNSGWGSYGAINGQRVSLEFNE